MCGQSKLLYHNRADGTFEDISPRGGPEIKRATASRGAASEDFDGDGDLDLVVVNLNEPPSLLLNQDTGNNWVIFKLVGHYSNKSAIGARVILESAGRRQRREVRSAASFYSSQGLRIHFGLGTARKIDVLQVFWPSGKESRFRDLLPNRVIVIQEEGGLQDSSRGSRVSP